MSEAVQTEVQTESTAPTFADVAAEVFGADAPAASSTTEPTTAPTPSEEGSAVESVAAEPPAVDPKAERVAARIAAATRAELKARQARLELAERERTLAAREAELEAKAARYKLLEEDPVKAFEVLSIEPKTFLEKLAGEHAPENVQSKKLQALEAELAALKEERQRERETAEQRAKREQAEAVWREASAGFVEFVQTTAEKYPHLVAEYTEHEALAQAERVLSETVGYDAHGRAVSRAEQYRLQFGEYPDNDVIAEYLDGLAKQRAEARQNSAWRAKVAATPASQATRTGDPNPAAHPVSKGSSPRTLTSRAASEKASASKQWTQEAADEESLRILKGAFRD